MQITKFKVNIHTGEIDLEGDQEFVSSTIDKLPKIIAEMRNSLAETNGDSPSPNVLRKSLIDPDSDYQAFRSKFKEGASDSMRCMIAGYFLSSKQKHFKSSEVTRILSEHDKKPANTSASLIGLVGRGLIVDSGVDGEKIKIYKITEKGENYLKSNAVSQ